MTEKSEGSKILEALGGCVALSFSIIGIIVVASIIEGFVVRLLWGWFVVPFGVSPISLAWAIGLSVTIGALAPAPTQRTTCMLKKYSTADKIADAFGIMFLRPGMLLLVGYIVHRAFMP